MPKSVARCRFDDFFETLDDRIASGECTDPIAEYRRMVEETRRHMTAREQAELREVELLAHELAEILAEDGSPVPWSDPRKPN
jgi:hypothetical protein